MMSPRATAWSSGTIRVELGAPPLSIASQQLYPPARRPSARSTASGRRFSSVVATQVEIAMMPA